MILDNPSSYVIGYLAAWLLFFLCCASAYRFLRKNRVSGFFRVAAANIVLTFLGVFLVLLLLEGYYGFFYDQTDAYGLTQTAERWFDRHYRFNNRVFRDDKDYAAKKAPGRTRIVFIGDSYTAGHGIRDINDRFTGIIESALKRAMPGSVEVYTIAQNGWGSVDELECLKALARSGVQIDMVVLCYTMNDIQGWTDETKAIYDTQPENWFYRHSFFLSFLHARLRVYSHPEYQRFYGWISAYYAGNAWQAERRRLTEFVDTCRMNGWVLKAVVFPLIDDLAADFEMKVGHDRVDAFFREKGIPFVDFADILRMHPKRRVTVNRFDSHPNEFAHKLIADEILRRLLY